MSFERESLSCSFPKLNNLKKVLAYIFMPHQSILFASDEPLNEIEGEYKHWARADQLPQEIYELYEQHRDRFEEIILFEQHLDKVSPAMLVGSHKESKSYRPIPTTKREIIATSGVNWERLEAIARSLADAAYALECENLIQNLEEEMAEEREKNIDNLLDGSIYQRFEEPKMRWEDLAETIRDLYFTDDLTVETSLDREELSIGGDSIPSKPALEADEEDAFTSIE